MSTDNQASDEFLDRRVVRGQERLKAEAKAFTDAAKALKKVATSLSPLTKAKAYADITKVPALLERVEKKVLSIPLVGDRGAAVIDQVRQDLETLRRRVREHLAPQLQEACSSHGLTFRVVRREEPVEIRLPPFGVIIDREKGRAQIQFAKLTLETCAADATEIIDARKRALDRLNADFDARRFFEACRRAWLAARGASEGATGDRIEIVDFLPYLALQFQRPAFHVEPSGANYRGYSRARFAWDVLQLRRKGNLSQGGWRFNLGVATGTTATKKSRVIWFEDEDGEGEFKLTVFFTKSEGAS